MKIFRCPHCSFEVYFENTQCIHCGSMMAYNPRTSDFEKINSSNSNSNNSEVPAVYCKNYQMSGCNWLVQSNRGPYCTCCSLNRYIPNKEDHENFEKYSKLELAKHRLVYQLLQLGLPIFPKTNETPNGLIFDFLTEDNPEGVVTGHADGVITILLLEADSVKREQLRKQMSEPYRTLIGHFRHEVGHYYYMHFFTDRNIDEFRSIFGDERSDYGQALQNHYDNGPIPDWNSSFISAYASSHPWEDWAETWAHYLHIMDTLETAHFTGLGIVEGTLSNALNLFPNPYDLNSFEEILNWSIKLTCAANSLNRSMGIPDIYPFVLPAPVHTKLNFIHETIRSYTQMICKNK